VENTPDTIARYDRQCRRTYINPALARSLGSAPEALGRTPAEGSTLVDPDEYIAKIKEVFDDGREREYEGATRRRNGKMKWAHIRFVPEFDEAGAVASVLAIGRDITEIVESRNKIQRMAFFDSLTGLPNRSLLNDSVHQLAIDARSGGRQFGLMMLDLDRFKEVNDTLGHAAGDALLCEVAARLRTCVRGSDMIARLGGDEFAILLPNMRRKADLFVPAAKILRSLAEPFHVGGREITVTTSIGITKFPLDGADIEILFKQADSAMYHAKRMGRNNFQFYTPEMTERTVQRLVIETTLRKACSRGELELYYQPQVALRSGEWLGAEALLRWNHPELGLLTPGKFVGIAEETGLIVDIGRWALSQACYAAADWNARRALPLRIAVNLSSRQFVMNDLVRSVREALQTAGCRPEWLELEITESLLLEDSHTVRSMLDELSALGVSIAIDDFGIGYSALGYLTRFPIDTLKIDRSFIHDIDTDAKRAELMKAIIAIAKALKLRLVAEGVENKTQVSFLLGNGCALAQGYLYGKPMPKNAFTELLRTTPPQSPVLTRRRKHASVVA
jgi:diguanylate cyclase (GGDEF)-like protein/PAS domain S-box-containing protein